MALTPPCPPIAMFSPLLRRRLFSAITDAPRRAATLSASDAISTMPPRHCIEGRLRRRCYAISPCSR